MAFTKYIQVVTTEPAPRYRAGQTAATLPRTPPERRFFVAGFFRLPVLDIHGNAHCLAGTGHGTLPP